MMILGVDTSGKHGSIALVRCDSGADTQKAFDRKARGEGPQNSQRNTSHTLEIVPLEGGTFSAQLVPQIAVLLQNHGLTKHEIDAFAVVSGPGSFTGLRVGLAAIKALAEILQKPIAAVSLLEAVVLASGVDGRVVAALDAGRGEVYVGTYDVHDGGAVCLSEQILAVTEFVGEVAGKQVATPDPKLADALTRNRAGMHRINPPQADAIARIGFRRLQQGETVSRQALDATYIRRSDAEIKLSSTRE